MTFPSRVISDLTRKASCSGEPPPASMPMLRNFSLISGRSRTRTISLLSTLMMAGGTLLQLGVPVMLAAYFAYHRQVPGTAFCSFFFFENFQNVATYMADARAQELP